MINSKLQSAFWMLTGLLACPCHLPLTLPLVLGLTAGTTLGVVLTKNLWVVAAISTMYFVGALALGFRSLRRNGARYALPLVHVSNSGQAGAAQFACCELEGD